MRPYSLGRFTACVVLTTLVALLTACDDKSLAERNPQYLDLPGDASLTALFGDTPAVRALDETMAARANWLTSQARNVSSEMDKKLSAQRKGAPRARPPMGRTAVFRSAVAASATASRTRVVSRGHASRTHSSEAGPVTTTSDTMMAIEDRTSTSRSTVETTAGAPPAPTARTKIDTSTTTDLCPIGDDIAGEWSTEQVIEVVKDGVRVKVTIRGHGTFTRTVDGNVSIPELTMTSTASGDAKSVDPIQVSGSVGAWRDEQGADIIEPAKLIQTGGAPDAETAFASPALMLLNIRESIASASRDGAERRQNGGICVRLDASADTGTLGVGETATITVRVTDPATGEDVPHAVVEAVPVDGETARTVAAPGTLEFTATGTRPSVFLSVQTPQGGDRVRVRFDVAGWQFKGVSYSAVTAVFGIPTVTTWQAEVCGDPFTNPWHARIIIESRLASPVLEGSFDAVDVKDGPGSDPVHLQIQAVEDPAAGKPPFRLWIDDTDPAATPKHQRVEVTTLEPVRGACTSR